jgi:hypothetical protein
MKTRSSVGWGYFELRTNKKRQKKWPPTPGWFQNYAIDFFRGANLREVT